MDSLFLLGFVGAAIAAVFAYMQTKKVMSYSEGTDRMAKLAASIRAGANAYLKQQYTTVGKVFVVVFIILLAMAFGTGGKMLSKFTPFAFVTGGLFSMLAGFIGMKIATNSNARTAQAASESLNKGLRVAFSSGSVMGFTVVGLGMLDITMWYFLLRGVFGINDPVALGNIMVMNGMGASFMALFARVGGGIYTKAADVGADLVGKVEAGIPEDDPRNPATIADNVGDNVGDVAGMGADLYESYVGSILATFSLGAIAGYGWDGMLLPLDKSLSIWTKKVPCSACDHGHPAPFSPGCAVLDTLTLHQKTQEPLISFPVTQDFPSLAKSHYSLKAETREVRPLVPGHIAG